MSESTVSLSLRQVIFGALIILLGSSLIWILATRQSLPETTAQTLTGTVTLTSTPPLPPSITYLPQFTKTLTSMATATPQLTATLTPTIPFTVSYIVKGSPWPATPIPTPSPTRNVTFEVVSKREIPLDNL